MDAIYARQSVDKADSLSIQGQIDLCRRETGQACQIYQDRGYSGKNTNRPAFRRLMADVEKGRVQKIVVYRLDRFSRSLSDFGRLWEILEGHQVAFVSVHETFDTATPMGRAMLNIIMVFAQLERETTAQRVRDNYYQRARSGAWPGGPAPYGFTLGRLAGPEGRPVPGLLPDGRADVVREIFAAYAREGATLGSVARALNQRGIPGPRRPAWDNVALSRMLHNPIYVAADEDVYLYYQAKGVGVANPPEDFDGRRAGMLVGRRDRGAGRYQAGKDQCFSLAAHRGLVPSGLWLACQAKLETNRRLGGRGRGKHTWLSGLLKCARCGYSVKVTCQKQACYLTCSGRSNLGVCDGSIRVELRALEGAVEGELQRLFSLCAHLALPEAETARAVAAIEEKIGRLVAAVAEGSPLTVSYLDQAVQRLEGERRALLAQRPPVRRPAAGLEISGLTWEEKKLVAARLIREIRLEGDRAEVIWRV